MRREHDSLGDKDVPSEALYGIQTQRAIENFPISGLPPRPELVDGIVLVKKAAALVNRELGLLPADKAEAIVRAADEVLGGAHRDQFRVDPFQAGAGTSHNMNANEVLANRANELLGGGTARQSTRRSIPTTTSTRASRRTTPSRRRSASPCSGRPKGWRRRCSSCSRPSRPRAPSSITS